MLKFVALTFAMTFTPAWSAAAVPAAHGLDSVLRLGSPPYVTLTQQDDIPDVVMLLARRAVRAERRGDMETANELYETIRELGYRVQRPGEQDDDDRSGDNRDRGGWFGARDRDRADRDDRNDDDDDDSGGRDRDSDRSGRDGGDSDGGDSDGGDSDGGDSDGGDSDGGDSDGDNDGDD